MQLRVRKQFQILQDMDDNQSAIVTTTTTNHNDSSNDHKSSSLWNVLDATETMEQVEEKIWKIVQRTIHNVKNQPVESLWEKKNRD